jgi:hypothetical protein
MGGQAERREMVDRALQVPGIDSGGLWFAYLGLGGTLGHHEIKAHLDGRLSLPPLEEDLLAEAARELLEACRPLPGGNPDPAHRSPGQ